ncbi:MAG: hypothetical protein ABEK42_06965, partial [Thiohalorhabdaceae bacterium]
MRNRIASLRSAITLALVGLAFVLPAIGVTNASSNAAESDSSASNPNPNALWAAQSHDVVKLRAADGSLLLELAQARVRAVATDPRRGTLWTYGRALKSFSPAGDPRTTTELRGEEERAAEDERGRGHGSPPEEEGGRGHSGGGDREGTGKGVPMAVSPGTVQWRLELDDEAEAVALDTQRNWLWVAQEGRLVAFAADGSRTARIGMDDRDGLEAEALAYAPDLDALWLAGEERLLRLVPDGTVAYRREIEAGERLAADGQGGLWLAGEHTLRHLATNGPVRFELRPFPRHGAIQDLAASPADGSVWAASPQGLARVARSGEVTHRKDYRGPGQRGRVWAL